MKYLPAASPGISICCMLFTCVNATQFALKHPSLERSWVEDFQWCILPSTWKLEQGRGEGHHAHHFLGPGSTKDSKHIIYSGCAASMSTSNSAGNRSLTSAYAAPYFTMIANCPAWYAVCVVIRPNASAFVFLPNSFVSITTSQSISDCAMIARSSTSALFCT